MLVLANSTCEKECLRRVLGWSFIVSDHGIGLSCAQTGEMTPVKLRASVWDLEVKIIPETETNNFLVSMRRQSAEGKALWNPKNQVLEAPLVNHTWRTTSCECNRKENKEEATVGWRPRDDEAQLECKKEVATTKGRGTGSVCGKVSKGH